MSPSTQWNQSYYGQPYASRQLVMQMQGTNPGADPLRDILTRYGAPAGPAPAAVAPPQQAPGYAPPYPPYPGVPPAGQAAQPAPPPSYNPPPAGQGYLTPPSGPGGRGPIQEQSLPPAAR
jgi:hypothetical protein